MNKKIQKQKQAPYLLEFYGEKREKMRHRRGVAVRNRRLVLLLSAALTLAGCGSGAAGAGDETDETVVTEEGAAAEGEGSAEEENAAETEMDESAVSGMDAPVIDASDAASDYDGLSVTLWVEESEEDFTREQIGTFQELYPQFSGVSFSVEPQTPSETIQRMTAGAATDSVDTTEEDDPSVEAAGGAAENDSGNGPDLYVFTQEYLEQLILCGALEELPSFYAETVQSQHAASAVLAASDGQDSSGLADLNENNEGTGQEAANAQEDDGILSADTEAKEEGAALYAYPLTSESGYFLYYDASVISDPSSLETIIADCETAGRKFYMELNSGWYQTAFFFGTGCTLRYEISADGSFTGAQVDYATEAGVAALREMLTVASSPAFGNGSTAGDAADMAALVGGLWDETLVQELLGENYACAPLPSFAGEDGISYRMSGFSGYELLGVTPQEDDAMAQVCHALAFWLTSEQVQQLRYEEEGLSPTCLAVQEMDSVQSDAALAAMLEQQSESVPQRQYPGDYWIMAAALGDDVVLGSLTEDASDEALLSALETFQDACLSYAE